MVRGYRYGEIMTLEKNGNGNGKIITTLLKSPYGWLFAISGCLYYFSKLPEKEFGNIQAILLSLNHPLGWAIVALLIFTIFYQLFLRPSVAYISGFLEKYMEKEAAHIKIMEGINDSLCDLRDLLERDLLDIMKEMHSCVEANRIKLIKIDNTLHDKK